MMTDMIYQKVKKYIVQQKMIGQGELVAAGVSGGADSVCLLALLRRLQRDILYRLIVVHVNHGVRPEAAEDAAYVEALCRRWDIPCYVREVDMPGYAREYKLSPEEAGRILRYRAFREVLEEQGEGNRGKIAVAHNANDRAETMLFQIFRGSGMEGFASIRPVRESVIRPVLCLTREEIEVYLEENKISFCEDSTNEGDAYARNRIRHHILSYAEREICSKAVLHMNELADILAETNAYLERETKRLFRIYAGRGITEQTCPEEEGQAAGTEAFNGCGCLRIRGESLLAEDPVMVKRVLLYALEQITPHRKDITGRHIAELMGLLRKGGSKELSLPHGIKAYKEYGILVLRREDGQAPVEKVVAGDCDGFPVKPPCELSVPGVGRLAVTLLDGDSVPSEWFLNKKEQNIPENRYTKWFDYDKITTSLLFRTRRPGDYLTIDKALHSQSVKQYMINEKIPKMQRGSMYLLTDGAHVLWIPEYRTSQYYRVDESTKCILQVQIRGGNHGGTS